MTYRTADGTVLCTVTLPVTSCTTPTTLPAGTYEVTATYSGDDDHDGAASAPVAFAVAPAQAHLTGTVDSGPNASTIHGDAATLNATGLDPTATGSIDYRAGTTVLCTATLPTTTCDTDVALASGVYDITANYTGDANHAPASSAAVHLTIARATPTLTDTVNGTQTATTGYGTTVVLNSTGYPSGATGTIEYLDQRGHVLCSSVLPATSCATIDTLAPGDYTVTATYRGDTDNDPATTRTAAALHITRVGVTILGSTVDGLPAVTVIHGRAAVLDTTGVPSGATGTIAYETADGAVLCTAPLPATSCTTATDLPGGTYQVTARYSGDGDHDAATGPALALRIVPQAITVAARSAFAVHSRNGSTALTVSGLPVDATGTVTFTTDGDVLCSVALPDRSCTTTTLHAGTHTVIASFSGDASYAASQTTLTVTVPAATPATATGLAFTGSESGTAALGAGVLLLVIGAAILFAARRRRGNTAR